MTIYLRVYEAEGKYYASRSVGKKIGFGREIFTLEGDNPDELDRRARAKAREQGIESVINLDR